MDFSAIEASLLDDDDDDLGFDLPSFSMDDTPKKKPAAKPTAKPADAAKSAPAKTAPASAHKPAVPVAPGRTPAKHAVAPKKMANVYKKPSSLPLNLSGKGTKQLQALYDQYESGGLSNSQFSEVLDALGVVDDDKVSHGDLPDIFAEATGSKTTATFKEYLQAMAIFALRRYPAGNDDPTAALDRLLAAVTGEEEQDKASEQEARKKAVTDATRRAAERAKATRLAKEAQEADALATGDAIPEKSPEEKAKEEEVARQRAYLRAKARIVADKEKHEQDKEQDEKNKVAEEERQLELAKLRAEARKRALQRAQDRVAQSKHAEEEALREEEELKKVKDEKNAKAREEAMKRAQERVKAAKEARKEEEAAEAQEQVKQETADQDLKLQKERMSSTGYLAAVERNKERLRAALKAEQEERERLEREAQARGEKDAVVVKEATARAQERTAVKKYEIALDEETEADLRKLFNPFAVQDRLHKPRWPDLLTKYKLVDGIHLKKSQLDLIFSKNAEKGTKGLDFHHFCLAIAEVGNTRFKTKDANPNDAINRVLLATVRKVDPKDVERRKAELAEQKREYEAEQRDIANRDQMRAEMEAERAHQEAEAKRAEREARLQALLEELEEDRVLNEQKAARKEKARIEREKREAEEAAVAKEERMREIQERNAELEEERKLAVKRTQERLATREKKEKEEADRKAAENVEKAERDAKLTEEGRKKAQARLAAKKKQEVHLNDADMQNMKTLFTHFKSGKLFNRGDWLNCTTSLGLEDGQRVSKADLERLFDMTERALNKGSSGLLLEHFCYAMGLLAVTTHPSENPSDNEPSKALERLLADVMGGSMGEEKEFDPNIDESALFADHLQESEEEKASRLEETRRKAQERAVAKKKREEEAKAKAEAEAQRDLEKKAENEKKVAEARQKASARIKQQKAEAFTISPHDQEQLEVLYEHFRIAVNGMTRADWLNCVSTLGVMDDDHVGKAQCVAVFEEVVAEKAHMSVDMFGVAMSKVAQRMYTEDNLNQSKALAKLVSSLMDN